MISALLQLAYNVISSGSLLFFICPHESHKIDLREVYPELLSKGYFALVHALINFKCIHDFRCTPIGKVFIERVGKKVYSFSFL
tara:strand:+ start:804 stop:1055 length:252 start_codon:yes stop_codon:yes gene_type:complete